MISNRHIKVITLTLLFLVTCGCLAAMCFSESLIQTFGKASYSMEYEIELFDTDEILDIAISMEEADWQAMLDNAASEVYYQCDVTINGKTFYRVGIRPKGNTSLSSVANDPNNDRYSFKLEFDQFVTGQTCFGLDKLVLNNNYADATNMKEAILYDMYQALDADASLYNYAKISVNDEYWGVYLALEAVEDSFLFRNYGTGKGKLYKPEGMMRSGGGANLNYMDDNLESYTAIWEGAVVDSDDADHRRVVTALEQIHAGNNLAAYMDIDNVLNYMTVHNFAVNDDSLSGGMVHNYYLYEQDGRLSILPWDYNLAFGGMHGGSGTELVNTPIDDSYQSTKFFDALLTNETYLAQYHAHYAELLAVYFDSGRFEETYQRIRTQIDALVEADPNAMYSYEEYLTAAEVLHEVVLLRAESVRGQLDGTIPSTSAGQRQDSTALIDGVHLNISAMGSFMGGKGGQMGMPQMGNFPFGAMDSQTEVNRSENNPSQQEMPADLPQIQTDAENRQPMQMPEGFEGFPGGVPEFGQNAEENNAQNKTENNNQNSTQNNFPNNRPQSDASNGNGMNNRPRGGMNGMPQMGGMASNQPTDSTVQTDQLVSLALCIGVLVLAFVFLKLYKRKTY